MKRSSIHLDSLLINAPYMVKNRPALLSKSSGFTLIELMVALLLGILVVVAATSVFVSGRRAYGTTQAINRIQENHRLIFEMMASDIRSASSYLCPSLDDPVWQVGNKNAAGGDKQALRYLLAIGMEGNSEIALQGRPNVDTSQDSIVLAMDFASGGSQNAIDKQYYAIDVHKSPNANLKLINGLDAAQLKRGDDPNLIAACNVDVAIVFGINGSQLSGNTIPVTTGAGVTDRCGGGFTRNPETISDCAATTDPKVAYCFTGKPSIKLSAAEKERCGEWGSSQAFVVNLADYDPTAQHANVWYVDKEGNLINPARGGRMVSGISKLELRYKLRDSNHYVDADTIRTNSRAFDFNKRRGGGHTETPISATGFHSDWKKVESVHLKMTFQDPDAAKGTDGQPLQRTMETYIAVRSHMLEY